MLPGYGGLGGGRVFVAPPPPPAASGDLSNSEGLKVATKVQLTHPFHMFLATLYNRASFVHEFQI